MSESELLYDWRFTANQFVLATNPLRLTASNFISQPNTCAYNPYATSSLMRACVCGLQLLLVLASAVIFRPESRVTKDHILLSQIPDSSKLEGQVPKCISPGIRWPSYIPRHWVPFSSPPMTRKGKVEICVPAPIWLKLERNRSWLISRYYPRISVEQISDNLGNFLSE
jgi:hypothetical protein